ncbi:hypothetical protein ACFQ0Q_41850 [Streptomyces aureus]
MPSSIAFRAARLRSSCDDSVNSRPIGTRWTAGGEEAGDIPKNRLNKSLKGSDELNPEPKDIDMPAPDAERLVQLKRDVSWAATAAKSTPLSTGITSVRECDPMAWAYLRT